MSAPHPPPPSDAAPSQCYILRLPDELLSDIVSTVASWPDNIDGTEFLSLYADRWTLTLVCRRFHVLATPLLYSRLVLTLRWTINASLSQSSDYLSITQERVEQLQSEHGGRGVMRLHRTLECNPALRGLCRELNLDLADSHWRHLTFLSRAASFVTWLTEVRSLRVHDGFGRTRTSPVMQLIGTAARYMSALEKLTYTAHYHPGIRGELPPESEMQKVVARFPRLRELHLVGCVKYFGVDYELLKTVRGQSPLTTISLNDSIDGVAALTSLLAWPSQLEQFTCLGRTRPGWSPLKFRNIWSALVPHLQSLKSVRVGSVENPSPYRTIRGKLGGIDFSLFSALTFLGVSVWSTGTDGGEAGLLAPRLEEFEWSFDGEDGRVLLLNYFGADEEGFLRRFAEAALEREVPLRRISVVFSPQPVVGLISFGLESLNPEYPWDCMDRLAGELKEVGVELTYNEPCVSREKFEEALGSARQLLRRPVLP
ncbi:hypothetical protein C8A05DRAFT_32549 [Staphylotrichum tortipilum]|uniref:F-box domain-containing protein n=1 Tax=Staphylotrichum tortipilum TaxID=2831512 RepID=A0AAN6MN33_9PEZI|nr:hypothetical protein C8A05DRAFT_32549 [Staphylotrichum longicolle]